MKIYVITGLEVCQSTPPTCTVRGAYPSLTQAQEALKKLTDESLTEFLDEYIDSETCRYVLIKSRTDPNYSYELYIELVDFEKENQNG